MSASRKKKHKSLQGINQIRTKQMKNNSWTQTMTIYIFFPAYCSRYDNVYCAVLSSFRWIWIQKGVHCNVSMYTRIEVSKHFLFKYLRAFVTHFPFSTWFAAFELWYSNSIQMAISNKVISICVCLFLFYWMESVCGYK